MAKHLDISHMLVTQIRKLPGCPTAEKYRALKSYLRAFAKFALKNGMGENCPEVVEAASRGRTSRVRAKDTQGTASASSKVTQSQTPPAQQSAAVVSSNQTPLQKANTLKATLERIREQEQDAHARLQVLKNSSGASAVDIGRQGKVWRELVDQRMKLEEKLPKIMHDAGRYVDADDIALVVSRAVVEMVGVLNQVGMTCGDRIADLITGADRPLTASDYRREIEREMERAKAGLQTALRNLYEKGDA